MSVAVHVTIVSPSGKNSGASFVIVTSCISDTDGLSRETIFSSIEVASYVKSSTGEISGEVVSTTETNCVSLAVFSEESDTVHVIIVSPSGKNSGASFEIEIISPLSVAPASPNSISLLSILVASITISSGVCKIGAVLSTTITFCSVVDVLPIMSAAVHVIIVSPSGKNSGASLVIDITPKISYAVGDSKSTIFSYGTIASTIISETGDMVGDVVSTTLTSCVAIVEFPLLSIAVHMIIAVPRPNLSGALLIIN